MKMGLGPITTIGACPIFMIQGAAPQHDQLYPFSELPESVTTHLPILNLTVHVR